MLKYFFSMTFLILFTFLSCNSSSHKTVTEMEKPVTEIITLIEDTVVAKPSFGKLPADLLNKFFVECNSLDATFYKSSKSVSLWNENVKHILTMFSNEAPTKLDNNLIGHLMLLKDGNQLSFVEISMKGDNNYMIFNIDDKKYYNVINQKGIQFFNKFID